MSTITLLPRLSYLNASQLLQETDNLPNFLSAPDPINISRGFEMAGFAATGGSVSRSRELVKEIAEELRRLAQECDQNTIRSRIESHAHFDKRAAQYLSTNPTLQSGEALRDDVWAFISIILIPDIIAWRFPNRNTSRYLGGVRNAIQRLWTRGTILDRGKEHPARWELIDKLTEDAMVQIFERASILASPGLALSIAEAWLETSMNENRSPMEEVTRTAIKMVRIRNEIIDLSSLNQEEIKIEIHTIFKKATFIKKEGLNQLKHPT